MFDEGDEEIPLLPERAEFAGGKDGRALLHLGRMVGPDIGRIGNDDVEAALGEDILKVKVPEEERALSRILQLVQTGLPFLVGCDSGVQLDDFRLRTPGPGILGEKFLLLGLGAQAAEHPRQFGLVLELLDLQIIPDGGNPLVDEAEDPLVD